MNYDNPIPDYSMPKKCIYYKFIDEELVDLDLYFAGKIIIEPAYYKKRISSAIDKCLVRLSVAQHLEKAVSILPNNLSFKVLDTWRPLSVQKCLYDKLYELNRKRHIDWDEKKVEEETIKFVSKPNYDMDNPAVHSTGGAIDLTLVYKDTKEMLSMGTKFDDFSEESSTSAFEGSEHKDIINNRRILYWTMTEAGFTNLPSEWWHYDYGDQFWSYYTKQPAIYRGIEK